MRVTCMLISDCNQNVQIRKLNKALTRHITLMQKHSVY